MSYKIYDIRKQLSPADVTFAKLHTVPIGPNEFVSVSGDKYGNSTFNYGKGWNDSSTGRKVGFVAAAAAVAVAVAGAAGLVWWMAFGRSKNKKF